MRETSGGEEKRENEKVTIIPLHLIVDGPRAHGQEKFILGTG